MWDLRCQLQRQYTNRTSFSNHKNVCSFFNKYYSVKRNLWYFDSVHIRFYCKKGQYWRNERAEFCLRRNIAGDGIVFSLNILALMSEKKMWICLISTCRTEDDQDDSGILIWSFLLWKTPAAKKSAINTCMHRRCKTLGLLFQNEVYRLQTFQACTCYYLDGFPKLNLGLKQLIDWQIIIEIVVNCFNGFLVHTESHQNVVYLRKKQFYLKYTKCISL